MLADEKPALIILSPPCAARSRMRNLSDFKRDSQVVADEREATCKHFEFSMKIARWQYRSGRGFLLERPVGTGEVAKKKIQSLLKLPGVMLVGVDMCEHGLRVIRSNGQE